MVKHILAAVTVSVAIASGVVVANAAQQKAMHVSLRSVGPSHVSGTAVIVYNASTHKTTVTLAVKGLSPGIHLTHIHVGHCGSNGDVRYPLAPLQANKAGSASSVTVLPTKLHGASSYINVHGVPGNIIKIVACGNLS